MAGDIDRPIKHSSAGAPSRTAQSQQQRPITWVSAAICSSPDLGAAYCAPAYSSGSTSIYLFISKYKLNNDFINYSKNAQVAASRNHSRITIENFAMSIHPNLIKLQSAPRY
jgi:hypothetical protein